MYIHVHRLGAGAVIHTHSKAAVMATLLYPGKEFKITHQEMIKGISRGQTGKKYRYHDELVVPIIENTPEESDLTVSDKINFYCARTIGMVRTFDPITVHGSSVM
jgi:methylthioribulose-1-phosphate dehydratase